MIAGTVTPRDDRTRKRVTGGIFLISATISAILVASRQDVREPRGDSVLRVTCDILCSTATDLTLSVIVFECGSMFLGTLHSRVPCLSTIATNKLPDELESITNPSFEGRHP